MTLKILVGKGSEGVYKFWNPGADFNHRVECEARRIHKSIWLHEDPDDDNPLPWRLTREEIKMLDKRMASVMWPHYMDRMYYNGASFWVKPNRIWKMIRKVRLLYYILPTQLRDVVPAFRDALHVFVWAMRRLEGQVHCYDEATRLNILPGSRAVVKNDIRAIHSALIFGLVLFEGCLPPSHLNPGMHHFCHYAEFTLTHGCLRRYWMMGFERYNKYLRQLVRNNKDPEAHLANSVSIDAAAAYLELSVDERYEVAKAFHHTCSLRLKQKFVGPTWKELADLRILGVGTDALSINIYSIANILGRHFKGGEWGKHPFCGSVITCVMNGRSVYGRVQRFISVDGDPSPGYASMLWFGEPVYPFNNPLVVCVDDKPEKLDEEIGVIIPITRIDPSRVVVEPTNDGRFMMMRQSGYDTIKTWEVLN